LSWKAVEDPKLQPPTEKVLVRKMVLGVPLTKVPVGTAFGFQFPTVPYWSSPTVPVHCAFCAWAMAVPSAVVTNNTESE
jgi:hypothetical protein